jgi:hypothetical protein
MGYEVGTVFTYNRKFYFYQDLVVKNQRQFFKLLGVDGVVIEVSARDCQSLIAPRDIDWDAYEAQPDEEELSE